MFFGLQFIDNNVFQISTIIGDLRYVDAMKLLNTMEDASKRLVSMALI